VALDDAQQRALDALREDGIAVLPFTELFDEGLWRDLRSNMEPFVREGEQAAAQAGPTPRKKNDIIIRRFHRAGGGDGGKHTFALDDPTLRIGSSDALLDVVSAYRNGWTKLYYADNWFTVPYPGADGRVASQQWHRDPEEEHVVKVFLYVGDVDEGTGPFEYVRSSAPGGRYGHLWPWRAGEGIRPPDDELAAAVAPGDRVVCTGPAGTLILCDTSGFHRGGFARTAPRISAVWTFVSPDSEPGREHRFEVDYEGCEDELSEQARFALA
jgi:hypothetical protein